MEALFFETPAELSVWFEAYHAAASKAWIGFRKRAAGQPSFTWPEAVDQALAVGWIDGVRQSIDASSYRIRFTPRKPRSIWSRVNLKRYIELEAEGRITPAGKAAYEAGVRPTDRYSYENAQQAFSEAQLSRFAAAPDARMWFETQPPSYRKQMVWWVVSAKKADTRDRRLDQLIEACRAGRRLLR